MNIILLYQLARYIPHKHFFTLELTDISLYWKTIANYPKRVFIHSIFTSTLNLHNSDTHTHRTHTRLIYTNGNNKFRFLQSIISKRHPKVAPAYMVHADWDAIGLSPLHCSLTRENETTIERRIKKNYSKINDVENILNCFEMVAQSKN